MFEALGLSKVSESVYNNLLQRPETDLSDLSKLCDEDHQTVSDAVWELEELSLVRRMSGPGTVLQPINPGIGLAALFANQQAEAVRRLQEVEEMRTTLTAFVASYMESHGESEEPSVERIDGIEPIRRRLIELAKNCEWEACSLMPGGAQSPESLEASRLLDSDAIERGVRLRTVYLDSVRNARYDHGVCPLVGGQGQ